MKKHNIYFALAILFSLLLFFPSCKNTETDTGVLEVSGLIEAVETQIRPEVSGQVMEIFVKEGQRVEKGQVLCQIDDIKIKIQINQIQAGMEGLQAKLKLFRKGTKKEIIAGAKNQLDAAQKELELATKNQERMTRLWGEGAVSEIQKEEADLKLKAITEKAETAEENYQMALRGREKEEIEIVDAEIKNLSAQQDLLLIQLEKTQITAPVSGTIEIRHIEVGELASPLLPLFSLIDLDQTYVKAYVPEKYLGNIRMGSAVEVTCDSYPEKSFQGKVDFISDQAEFAPKNIQTKEERLKLVFMIKSYLNNPDQVLKPGMPVDVRISIE
ncbi:MAG: efflux RND transporter periplasmic adaptor subunit [Candidatus Aminicenantes bacterium]|nr:efflux RND transporter periplasmic adaptor subunit [Candidatus Aminicenantes bacterium]